MFWLAGVILFLTFIALALGTLASIVGVIAGLDEEDWP